MQVSKQSISSLKGNFFTTFYTAGSGTKPCVVFVKVPVAVVDVVVEQLSCPGPERSGSLWLGDSDGNHDCDEEDSKRIRWWSVV